MLFSERDVDLLKLICWCQYVRQPNIAALASETELENLGCLGFLKYHSKSDAFVLTRKGFTFLQEVCGETMPTLTKSYHEAAIQRRLRQSTVAITAYQGLVDIFLTAPENLSVSPSLFLSAITRGNEKNPWGNTRIMGIAHIGDLFCAVHYVYPHIGKLALINELTTLSNQTAQYRNVKRAFIFAGASYSDILAELEQHSQTDAQLISYGDAYRCLQLPVHLLSCDSTGAVQLQIMSVPNYRKRLTQAALKKQYQPPPADAPDWDAVFQGLPFVMAADMDLRRIDATIRLAHQRGLRKIAIAALEGQAEAVLFPRYRDTGLARVFILTNEAISTVTGRLPVPYTPPHTQFTTPKGDVVDAPPLQTGGKAGGSR